MKAYPAELADGRVHVANKVARALFDLIDARHPGAVLAAAKQYLPGFGQEDGATLTVSAKADARAAGIEVHFRGPDKERYTDEQWSGAPLPDGSQPYSAKILSHPRLVEHVARPIGDSLVGDPPQPEKPQPIRQKHLGHWVQWNESTHSWEHCGGEDNAA